MTDPAGRRRVHDGAEDDTDRDMHVSEAERRQNDPTKQVYGAYDDPEEAIRTADPERTDGESLFEIMGDDETSASVPDQPHHDGVGPFSAPIVVIVITLVIFVVLLVAFG